MHLYLWSLLSWNILKLDEVLIQNFALNLLTHFSGENKAHVA